MRFIGSKLNLLKEIEDFIDKNVKEDASTLLDLFAGTNTVANHFKRTYRVYTNDKLYFSFVNAKAIIENNKPLKFKGLKEIGINSPFEYLDRESENYIKKDIIGYYEKSYSPTGDAMYLSVENAKRIDFIRDKIDEWKKENRLTEHEYYYLVSTLIEAIPYVSNTTGTYGAFLKHWDKRALNKLELIPLEIIDNGKKNSAFNEDSNELVKKVSADIVYIDTPYNNRQYASNYHLLENVSLNNKPELRGKTKIFDWSSKRSDYSMKQKAYKAMEDLIKNVDATHIVLSYNNEGIIDEDDLINLLKNESIDNNVVVKKIPYRKYKSKVPSSTYELNELLLYIQKKELIKEKNKKGSRSINKVWKMKNDKPLKSPLNYIGGKYKILPQILPLFPEKINTFVDLFSGGANVGINVEANHYVFNDMNHRINEMFRFFSKQDPDTLVSQINNRIDEYKLSKTNEVGYLAFRETYNTNPNPLDLYVLVSFSYNYQFRFNNSMKFNNPFGRNRSSFSENMERNLRAFIERLNEIDAEFTDYLFDEIDLSNLSEDDFVYMDPPYLITTANYNDGDRGFVNWDEKQEQKLYDLMKNLNNRNIPFALSNVLSHKGRKNEMLISFIKEEGLYVNPINHTYKNSSYNTKTGESEEVLITNYKLQID